MSGRERDESSSAKKRRERAQRRVVSLTHAWQACLEQDPFESARVATIRPAPTGEAIRDPAERVLPALLRDEGGSRTSGMQLILGVAVGLADDVRAGPVRVDP